MPIDNSRQRSLYFLILATLRKLVSQSEDLPSARELAKNLTVLENSESWEVATSLRSEKIVVMVPKTDFRFYPTKDLSSYEVEPSKQNAASAKSVIKALFEEAGISNSQFPVVSKSESKKKRFSSLKLNILEIPTLFIVVLLLQLRFIPANAMILAKVLFGAYLFVSLIGKRKVQVEFRKFTIPLIAFGTLSYFAQISLEENVQLIFVSYLILMKIFEYLFVLRIRTWYVSALSISAALWILQSANQNINAKHIGICIIILSVFFLNFSKTLKIRSITRQVSLLSGIFSYLSGLILIFDFSVGGISGIFFIIAVALIKQLTSSGDSSTEIYLGVGWVISS